MAQTEPKHFTPLAPKRVQDHAKGNQDQSTEETPRASSASHPRVPPALLKAQLKHVVQVGMLIFQTV